MNENLKLILAALDRAVVVLLLFGAFGGGMGPMGSMGRMMSGGIINLGRDRPGLWAVRGIRLAVTVTTLSAFGLILAVTVAVAIIRRCKRPSRYPHKMAANTAGRV